MGNSNILIIQVDQLRQDCLGTYGNHQIRSPNIDALARDGTTYSNHYTAYPVCIPARYSFVTGLPYNRIYDLRNTESNGRLSFPFTTFPHELKRAGYHTAAIGKMHYEPPYHDVGFEEMFLCEQIGVGRWVDDYHRDLRERGLVNTNCLEDQNWEFREYADEEYWETFGAKQNVLNEADASTGWIGSNACDAIERWDGSTPELLMVSFVKPHHPFDPPAPWAGTYDPESLDPLPGWTEHGLLRDTFQATGHFENRRLTRRTYLKVLSYYYALISEVDHQVGQLIAKLRENALYNDTMIVFTSDHGEYMGYHHMILKGNHMYEPLVKIPLLIKYPQGKLAGESNTSLSSNTDIARTILSVAGVGSPDQLAGTCDLSAAPDSGREAIVSHERLGARTMVRQGRYKLQIDRNLAAEDSFHWGSIVPDGGVMLFDLEDDPYEFSNVAESHPDTVSLLKQKLVEFQGDVELRGSFFANEFNAPIITAPNAQAASRARVQEGIDHFLQAFKAERGIET